MSQVGRRRCLLETPTRSSSSAARNALSGIPQEEARLSGGTRANSDPPVLLNDGVFLSGPPRSARTLREVGERRSSEHADG